MFDIVTVVIGLLLAMQNLYVLMSYRNNWLIQFSFQRNRYFPINSKINKVMTITIH